MTKFGVKSTKEYTVSANFYTKNGIKYPRSTAVMGKTVYNPQLDGWRLSVGFKISEMIRDKAGLRGTRIHEIFEGLVNGSIDWDYDILDTDPNYTDKYIKHFGSFVKHHDPKFISTERTLFSEKYQYATTTDSLGILEEFSDLPITIEYKTSKKIRPSFLYQAAAERNLFEENGTKTGGAAILRVTPKEYELLFLKPKECDLYFKRYVAFLEHFREFIMDEL